MLPQLSRMPILHKMGKKKPKMSRRNQTILKKCTMKLTLELQLIHRQLNLIANRKLFLPNLLMMKQLKNLQTNNHPKIVPMITLLKNNQKMTITPSAHQPIGNPS